MRAFSLSCVVVALLAACGADNADGTGSWTEVSAMPRPPGRISGQLVALPDGTAVLFGGSSSVSGGAGNLLGDTWQLDGASATWQELQPAQTPGPRFELAMAALGDRVILFGGSGGGTHDDTWQLKDGTWSEIMPAHRPPPRQTAAMAALGNELVLFGGVRLSTGVYGDTWVFDGTDWTQKTPAHSPAGRTYHTMVTVGDRILMYGGGTNELWQWKDDDWTLLDATGPSPGSAAVAAYGDGLIVVGGAVEGTWTWDPSAGWHQQAAGAPLTRNYAMATTLPDGDVILFGGAADLEMPILDETWRYR